MQLQDKAPSTTATRLLPRRPSGIKTLHLRERERDSGKEVDQEAGGLSCSPADAVWSLDLLSEMAFTVWNLVECS